MSQPGSKLDVTVYASGEDYASSAQIIRSEEELIVSFSAQPLKALRESPLHPHAQPVAKKHYAVSRDSGSTWTYTDQPPGLFGLVHATHRRVVLQDGRLLSVRHELVPGTTTLLPLAVVIHKDTLGGAGEWEVELTDFGPFDSCHDWEVRRLEDGSLLLAGYAPCPEKRPSKPIEGADFDGPWPEGVARYSPLFLHGSGDGRKWKYLSHIRNDHVFGLAEPSLIAFPGGRIVTMIRAEWSRAFGDKLPEDVNGNGLKREGTGYYFYQSESTDGGRSWSEPAKLDIWGHPAHLLELQSGNVVMVYGHRRPPFSVRAILSRDQCRTWDLDTMRTLHTWEPGNYDLGYPSATQLPDGRIFCCYYGYSTDDVGEKQPHGIFATIFDEAWLSAPEEPASDYQKPGVKQFLPAFYENALDRMTFPMSWVSGGYEDFDTWRAAARAKAIECLLTPPPAGPFRPEIIDEQDRGGYVARKLLLNISGDSRVLAYLLVPKEKGPFPAVLLLHDHGARFDIGKEKVIRPFADARKLVSAQEFVEVCYGGRWIGEELARRGYVCFCTDALNWSDRGGADFDGQNALGSNLLHMGMSLAGLIAHEDMRAAEFVSSLAEVDADRIAAMGLSMGCYRTWQLCALTDRIAAGVAVCWMGTIAGQMQPGINQTRGQSAYTMLHPNLHNFLDYPDVASIACPKPMLFYNGRRDDLFPVPDVQRAYEKMRRVWESQKAGEGLETRLWDVPHEFNIQMQDAAFEWLDKALGR